MRAEIFRKFEEPIPGPRGESYAARICGRPDSRDRWEGWIEFESFDGGTTLRTERETVQPNRRIFEGWAERLSFVYLEGALKRSISRDAARPAGIPNGPPEIPHFEGPAPPSTRVRSVAPDDAALNPILLYSRGEDVLRRELDRLSATELRTVVRAFSLSGDERMELESFSASELRTLVMTAVRFRLG